MGAALIIVGCSLSAAAIADHYLGPVQSVKMTTTAFRLVMLISILG
jgi:hypothetical protein